MPIKVMVHVKEFVPICALVADLRGVLLAVDIVQLYSYIYALCK